MSRFISKYTVVNGKQIKYYESGKKDNQAPVLMLHGFMSDATSLKQLAEALKTDQRVIIPDLPGFGGSDSLDTTEGLHGYVTWLQSFLNHIHVPNPTSVVGYSFGAYIAVLYTARSKSSQKTKLILLTPVVKIDWKVRMYGKGFNFMAVQSSDFAQRLYMLQYNMTTRYLRKNRHPQNRSALMAQRRSELDYFRPELALQLFKEFLSLNMTELAPNVSVPTIIVVASRDNVAAKGATKRFAEQIKGSVTVIEFYGAGHLLPMEEPSALATALRSYISS